MSNGPSQCSTLTKISTTIYRYSRRSPLRSPPPSRNGPGARLRLSVDDGDMEARPQLKRALGAWDLTFLSVVAIANLNLVPVIAANGPTTVWLWAAALVLFLLPQGITVIELSHRFPGEGGLYI